VLDHGRPPVVVLVDLVQLVLGEGVAEDTMGSNSRVRAVRARRELGWQPTARGLIEDIEQGGHR